MPILTLKAFVVILAMLSMIHIIGAWVDRRNLQKTAALKDWIHRQDKPRTVIYL